MTKQNSLYEKFKSYIKEQTKYNIILLVLFVLLRTFEFFLIQNSHSIPANAYKFTLFGYFFDLLYILVFTALAFLPFFVFYRLNVKIFRVIYFFTIFVLLSAYVSLILFFNEALIPLDSSLFAYSYTDIKETITANGGVTLLEIAYFIILYFTTTALYFFTRKIKIKKNISLTWIFGTVISVFLIFFIVPRKIDYKFNIEYYLTENKLVYFIDKISEYGLSESEKKEITVKDIIENIKKYQEINKHFDYTSKEYPLLHKSTDYKDVIGGYFNLKEEKPNIVIIIIESMSRAFSGEDAYLGSFTPFLDSLADKSLYWENMLSAAERTFGVLPNITASAPYGEKGFITYNEKAPCYLSLIEILRKQDYYSSFYYGGWNYFQGMGFFLETSKIDFLIEENFGKNYQRTGCDDKGFSWGFNDESLFRKSFKIIERKKKKTRLDIYLTMNMHAPFVPPNGNYWFEKYEEKINELELSEEEISEIYEKDKNKFACILSTDGAIKYFFDEYKKRDDFENTIFFITGDHRMGPIYHRSEIDKYHVPLIIYSPMLKEAKKFSAVVSHLDIAPTIAAFFREKYNAELPTEVPWLGQVLDTFPKFRSMKETAFMRNNRKIPDYLSGNYYLSEGILYSLSEGMKLKSDNNKNTEEVKNKLNNFKFINNYVCRNNKIYPKEDYQKYVKYGNSIKEKSTREILIKSTDTIINIINEDFESVSTMLMIRGTVNFELSVEKPLKIIIEITDKETNKQIKHISRNISPHQLYNKKQGLRITETIDFINSQKKGKYKINVYFWNLNKLDVKTRFIFRLYS